MNRWEEVSVVDTYYSRLVPDILLAVFHCSTLRCCPNTLTPYLRTLHTVLLPQNRACHSCQRKKLFIQRICFTVAHLNDFHSKATRLMPYCITTTFPLCHLGLLTFLSTFQSSSFYLKHTNEAQIQITELKNSRKIKTVELLF